MEAIKWLRNLVSSSEKLLMLPLGSEVYQVKARPVRVMEKNLHKSAGFVVYNTIIFL